MLNVVTKAPFFGGCVHDPPPTDVRPCQGSGEAGDASGEASAWVGQAGGPVKTLEAAMYPFCKL